MASFRWPNDAARLDFELLREAAVSLYFSHQVLSEHVEWLGQHGYTVHFFDASDWRSEDDFHEAIQRVLFPAYGGRNLNAFNDWICRIEVPEEGGVVLAFLAFDTLFRAEPEGAWHVLDILAKWSRFFLLTGRRLLTLVQSDDADLGNKLKPVGGRPILLNRPEAARYGRERRERARRDSGIPPREG